MCRSLATTRSTFLHYWCRFVCWVLHYCTIQSFESHTSCTVTCVAMVTQQTVMQTSMAHMSFVDTIPAMTFFLCWTTTSLLLWLYICWAKYVKLVEAWYPHVLNTWPSCIATYTPFLPSISCNTICAPLSSSSPVLFPAMSLPNGIHRCFTFTHSCFTVSHPSSAFTTTYSHKLSVVDNSYAHVHFTSLLTAEPEPWPSEQDVYITGTEQDNDETGIAVLQPNAGRRCQAVHALPPVGHQWQHYIDRFDTEGTTPVLGLASRWVNGSVFNKRNVIGNPY